MKKYKIVMAVFSVFAFTTVAYAISENANQNQEQAQTQNQGETTQIQNQNTEQTQSNSTQTGTMTQEQKQTQLQNNVPQYTPQNQNSYMHMNQVQNEVENMLNFSYSLQNQGLANQIQTVAQNQVQSEDKVNEAIDMADKRGSFSKFFIGPDYKQLKLVKQEMEQNQLRIQELNQIMTQLSNQSEQTELQNIIQTLEMQNTELQNQLNNQISGFSIFGWLFKWIAGY